MLVGFVIILVVIIGMVPIIVEQTQTLIISIPKYIEMVRDYLDAYSDNAYMQVVIEYINNNLNTSKMSSEAVTIATSVAQGVASSLSATATILMTMPFVLFFLLKDASNFKEYLVSLLPKN